MPEQDGGPLLIFLVYPFLPSFFLIRSGLRRRSTNRGGGRVVDGDDVRHNL